MNISVGIPIFNAEEYLAFAVQSVLNQTFKEFELILLDDGSTDNSLNIAKSFDDPRIRIISDGKNLGLPARLNQITQLAKYDLIARMDADDLIPSDRLEKQVKYLRVNLDKDLVTTGCAYVSDERVLGVSIPNESYNNTLQSMMTGQHGICHASLLVRKNWYQRNKYDESMHRVEDYELWLRAFINDDLKVGHLSEVGYYYRSDVTLSLNKYVNTFKGGLLVANKHNLPFSYKLKMILKICASYAIFFTKLEGQLLSKLRTSTNFSELSTSYQKLLKNLQREKLN